MIENIQETNARQLSNYPFLLTSDTNLGHTIIAANAIWSCCIHVCNAQLPIHILKISKSGGIITMTLTDATGAVVSTALIRSGMKVISLSNTQGTPAGLMACDNLFLILNTELNMSNTALLTYPKSKFQFLPECCVAYKLGNSITINGELLPDSLIFTANVQYTSTNNKLSINNFGSMERTVEDLQTFLRYIRLPSNELEWSMKSEKIDLKGYTVILKPYKFSDIRVLTSGSKISIVGTPDV